MDGAYSILELFDEFGTYIKDEAGSSEFFKKMLKMLDELWPEERLVLDLKNVILISPIPVDVLINDLKKRKFCRVVVKDPNDSVQRVLQYCLKGSGLSILVLFTVSGKMDRIAEDGVLNLSDHLRTTLNLISRYGPISSGDLQKELDERGENGTTAREYASQLYKRGLVSRKPLARISGRPIYLYSKFTLKG